MKSNSYKKTKVLLFSCIILCLNYFSCSDSETKVEKSLMSRTLTDSPIKNDPLIQKAWNVQEAFTKIYELYQDRVVFISTEQNVRIPEWYSMFGMPQVQKQQGLGSGFIISSDGFVCTNFHVIAPSGVVVDKVTVKIGEHEYEAEVRGYDEALDIALIKIEPDKKLKPVFLGNSDELKVGDWAVAIGNPFGLDKSFTVGVVSAINRKNLDRNSNEEYIQTDAAINPGNSGGPLINIRGEVIGVNRMIFSKSGGYMGIGFAIPINNVTEILDKLKKQKYVEKGYIGVSLLPVTQEYSKQLKWNYNYGVIIRSVERGGPADVAGLRPGDIIYEVSGRKVNSMDVLVEEVEKVGPASKVNVKVWRRGRRIRYTLRTAKKPSVFTQ